MKTCFLSFSPLPSCSPQSFSSFHFNQKSKKTHSCVHMIVMCKQCCCFLKTFFHTFQKSSTCLSPCFCIFFDFPSSFNIFKLANLFVFKQSNLFAFPNVKSLYLSTVLCEHQLSVCLFDLFCIVTCPGLIPHAVCASFIMGQGCGPRRQTGAALCGCVHFLTKNVSTKSQICLLFASYHEQSSLSCRQEPSSMKQTFIQ